jgi:type II secretory ATPase GspE/PulE/Tfp pilus assembly ATPase PilB-like protein
MPETPKLKRAKQILELLLKAQLLSSFYNEKYLKRVEEEDLELDILLIQDHVLSEEDYLSVLFEKTHIPPILLDCYRPSASLVHLFPKEIAFSYGILPLEQVGNAFTLAIANPFDVFILDYIHEYVQKFRNFQTQHPEKSPSLLPHFSPFILPVLTSYWALEKQFAFFYKKEEETHIFQADSVEVVQLSQKLEELYQNDPDLVSPVLLEIPKGSEAESEKGVAKLINQIILDAYQGGASDIHIEPYLNKNIVIRFRIDGECKRVAELPSFLKNAICSRIKIMCDLDIAEHRKAQDGKIKFRNWSPHDIELRVAIIPTIGGNEDIVMRILAASKPIPLQELSMCPPVYEGVQKIIQKPYGIFLVVGPTGSGKTTTLHSCMGVVNTESQKIWTAEDPVEITQEGLRQVHCTPHIDFKKAMRAFLRGDPDVIMVGEIRDTETAAIAIEASLTGHLVLSTLHTNNAPETIVRLLELGIDSFAFSDSLLAILAQRLMRTLCTYCKEAYRATDKQKEVLFQELGNLKLLEYLNLNPQQKMQFFRLVGCEKCNHTGKKGRMGLFEFMVNTPELKTLISAKANGRELRELALKQGMITLKQDGVLKVFQGYSLLAEVLRVCME